MSIEVLRPGPLTTLQDLGRIGYQRYGVVVGGAMDEGAHRHANWLVGNPEHEATLELTLQGPSLDFHDETLLAVCGADMAAHAGDHPLPLNRPVLVRAGTRVDFGFSRSGCRSYLAVRGGYDVPPVMGSRSTFLRARFGGLEGRALRKGDWLRLRKAEGDWLPSLRDALRDGDAPLAAPRWAVRGRSWLAQPEPKIVRIIPGRHWEKFSRAALDRLTRGEYRVSANSDRMGYRLEGTALVLKRKIEIISEAVAFGSIQIPHDGHPIVLMADRQTTGGYPKIAEVIAVDLPLLAQMRPGERLRFAVVALEQAEGWYAQRARDWSGLRHAIEQRTGG